MRSKVIILSSMLLMSCDDSSTEILECPTVINPVIIPAVTVQLFDESKSALNFCDAIVTIDRDDYHEVFYGSDYEDCTTTFSISGGYNLTSHDVLVEKAGYKFQTFENVLPVELECGYESFELNVYLEVD